MKSQGFFPFVLLFGVTLLLFISPTETVSAGAEHPWLYGRPARTTNLAYERHYIEAFAWPSSVKSGESITIYVSVYPYQQESRFTLAVYRLPDDLNAYYSYPTLLQGQFFPLHKADGTPIGWGQTTGVPVEYRNGCLVYWSQGGGTTINTSGWPSGLYFAKVIHYGLPGDHADKAYNAPFIVRAATPGSNSTVLFKYDISTDQAYNWYGGGSLYADSQDPATLTLDSIIATDRPLLAPTVPNGLLYAAKQFIHLTDSLGYSMEYCNNFDIDSLRGGFLNSYKALVIWRHDEYWAPDERTATEVFKDDQHHNSIVRFAANSCYRKITWVGAATGSKYHQLMCYKLFPLQNPYVQRELWRVAYGGSASNPEAKLLGEEYENGYNDANESGGQAKEPADTVRKPTHWIFRGTTGLATVGSAFGKGFTDSYQHGILGIELENTHTFRDSVKYLLDTLGSAWVASNIGGSYGPILHQMIYAEDSTTNSRVFAAGTEDWWQGFDYRAGNTPDVTNIKVMTKNIMDHFSGRKYIGKVYTTYANRVTWQSNIELDGNVQIPAGKYLVSQSNTITIDSTFTIDGTLELSGNVTMAGAGTLKVGATGRVIVNASSSLTIASGTTLQALAGSTFTFGTSAFLTMNGKLLAQGTSGEKVTFTSISPSGTWSGIVISGSGANGSTLDYVTVNHVQTASGGSCIAITGATGTAVRNSNISGNSSTGLSFSSAGAPDVWYDTISANTGYGVSYTNTSGSFWKNRILSNGSDAVRCYNHSSPSFGRSGYPAYSGNSIMTASGEVLYCALNSSPTIGLLSNSAYIKNSITSPSTGIHLNAIEFCTVRAEQVWWGSATLNPNWFQAIIGSSIDHDPFLTTDPYGQGLMAGPEGSPSGESHDSLRLALELRLAGEYTKANDVLLALLDGSTSSPLQRQHILCEILTLYRESPEGNLFAACQKLRQASSKADPVLSLIVAKMLVLQGKSAEATQLYEEIAALEPGTPCEETALVDLFALAYADGSLKEDLGAKTLSLLQEKYPEEWATKEATWLMTLKEAEAGGSLQKALAGPMNKTNVPEVYSLSENFPNPFNPSTAMWMGLPEAAHVSLIVYDILGRQVATVASGYHEAGYHTVNWNAPGSASGVYIARLTVTEHSGRVVYTKANKLLLMK